MLRKQSAPMSWSGIFLASLPLQPSYPAMNASSIPQVNNDYAVEKFDDEILLYNEKTTKAVYLNETAHAVWQLCQEEVSVTEIIEYLGKIYPEQKKQIQEDVSQAISSLCEHGVIELGDE